ncbi:hypothetical protein A33K_14742 [Burkholderia humptydooensis MSMB43]|uniref:Core-binding (CB) domain-containing protein n=1 Tax=Burkholderia humptydooensis MSMB43 TaxID=441157 RepID=A0ABN0G908_9BURK|nr:hypothetical protein A33K_14742 [Burkholderia humptydooensis MSMB43]
MVSYIGKKENLPFFEKALTNVRISFSGLACADEFIAAFVLWCNSGKRKAKRNFETGQSQVFKGWVTFLWKRGLQELPTHEITRSTTDDFILYLKKESGLAYDTQRRYWGIVRQFLEEMRKNVDLRRRLSPDLSWQNRPYPRSAGDKNSAEALDAVTLGGLLRACRQEATETIRDFWPLRAVITGRKPYLPDETRRGRGRYAAIEACVWRLKERHMPLIPQQVELNRIDRDLGHAIQNIHGLHRVTLPFYPTPERLIPFVLLHAIYTFGNTGPLLGMRLRQITHKEVLGVKRIVYRFVKHRAKKQYLRSFAHQDDDPLSPAKLHEFVVAWTSRIREHAGIFANNLYVFVTRERVVRGFLTGEQSGSDSDQCWKYALNEFLKRHSLPKITISNLRATGLDIVRVLSGDDLRAVKAAGGQESAQVIRDHYEGVPAQGRRQEALGEVMTTMEGWIITEGRIDPRGAPTYSDILAATPGWHCADPFDSPIPGEVKGRRCQAFGRCPGCGLGTVNKFSAYSLARTLQLLEEVKAAREYLDTPRWNEAYKEVQIALQEKWIPSFTDKDIWDAASKLSLNPIGWLE